MSTHAGDHSRYRAMLGRMLRAYARRVATSSPEDLAEMVTLRATLEANITEAVVGLRQQGYSWAEIARPLGISKQAVASRYGAAEHWASAEETPTEAKRASRAHAHYTGDHSRCTPAMCPHARLAVVAGV